MRRHAREWLIFTDVFHMPNIKMELITKQGKNEIQENYLKFYLLIFRNNKRVAEIWLENYKQYLYARHPERYEHLDVGDISKQLALKQKLQCKPFSIFFDLIAPDMLERFPFVDFPDFASGTVCEIIFPTYLI